jgi:catechol 2,3-dioxygenase-like lactoylglutathione lyase family enzyme
MLGTAKIISFLAATDAAAATTFFRDVLGLRFVEDAGVALVFDAGDTMLRIQKVQAFTPHPFTGLGWRVADIAATVDDLVAKGVRMERYDFLPQDERGIWTTPNGDKTCWFHDPAGNTLSLTQFVRAG